MKQNLLYVLAGIAIGVFGYTLFTQLTLGSLGGGRVATTNRLEENSDVEKLQRQLELSQKRVTQLESLIGAATLANDRINSISQRKEEDINRIANLKGLIDSAKPFLRELILPELEEAMANGDYKDVASFMEWADELELSNSQRASLQKRFEELSRQNAEELLEQIKDDETSMFSIFKQMENYEADIGPEIDAIYQSELDSEQFLKYQEKQFEKRTQQVADQADSRLDGLNRQITDLSESQQDQIFALMARRSPYYASNMEIEVESSSVSNGEPIADDDALFQRIDQVILPHQRDDWKKYQRRQKLLSGLGAN
ncbi:MAG: hypothetical protein AAF571_02860 [Verrucomicrobiota bacterium]